MKLLDRFKDRREETPFLIFLSFAVSFAVTRVYATVYEPVLDIGDYTFYHLYLGVALIIVAGWLAINYKDRDLTRVNALIFGVGLGVFFDQIGFMLTHFEDYWAGVTYSVVILVSLVLLNVVYFSDFWRAVGSGFYSYAEKKNLRYGPLNLMGLVSILGRVEKNMPKTNDLVAGFIGVVLMIAGFLSLEWPDLIRYWISGAFFLSGIAYILRAIRSSS